jgi:hypothetical protein
LGTRQPALKNDTSEGGNVRFANVEPYPRSVMALGARWDTTPLGLNANGLVEPACHPLPGRLLSIV